MLEALEVIRTETGETPAPAELLAVAPGSIRLGLAEERRLAGLLNQLGIVRPQVRAGDKRRWFYVLQADQLADRGSRYGVGIDAADESGDALSSTGVSPLSPVVIGFCTGKQDTGARDGRPKARIEKLVGRLGAPIEVRVPWLESTLWFIADEQHAKALVRECRPRARVDGEGADGGDRRVR